MMRRAYHVGCGMLMIVVLTAAPALAQVSFGPRAGLSGNPDQFFVGAHVESMDLGHRTTFRPNVEAGFGDDVTLVTVDLDLVHWMPLKNSRWQVYAGGGIGTNFAIADEAKDMYGALHIVFGVQHDRGLFGEMKVGTDPGVKLAVGYSMKIGG
jgi:hypothetical protein